MTKQLPNYKKRKSFIYYIKVHQGRNDKRGYPEVIKFIIKIKL